VRDRQRFTGTCSTPTPSYWTEYSTAATRPRAPRKWRWPVRWPRSPPPWLNTPDHLPENLLARIGHKHASLGVEPDQYQVVHDALMWAIADVLGGAVTPRVAAAWEQVYWLMAYTLTHIERGIYSARGVRPQTVWRQWKVQQKIPETDDAVTFVVKRTDDLLVSLSCRPVRHGADDAAGRHPAAAPAQPAPGRQGADSPVHGQEGARRGKARRTVLDAAARHGQGGRRAD